MRPKATIAGGSYVFNFLFVALQVLGLSSLVLGFHPYFESNNLLLKLLGFVLIAVSLGGLILFKGRLMMHNFARVFVGSMLLVSGLVKANDPYGFAYKLEEYFQDGALAYRIKQGFGMTDFSLEYLIPVAVGLAIFICVAEIILGVMILFRQKMKIVSILVVLMMLFFTFLTWHTSTCNPHGKFKDQDTYALNDPIGRQKLEQAKKDSEIKILSKSGNIVVEEMKSTQCVNDCGCFGDAMKGSIGRSLTPAESLWKDIVLLYLSIWLLLGAFKRNAVKEENRTYFVFFSLLFVAFLSWLFSWYFLLVFAFIVYLGSLWFLRKDKVNNKVHLWVVALVTIFTSALIVYVMLYEPLKDYRPYAVGSKLKWKMLNGVEGKYKDIFVYKHRKTGEIKEFDTSTKAYTSSRIWEDKNWVYLRKKSVVLVPGRLASISEQFNPFRLTENLSENEYALSFVADYYLTKTETYFTVYDKLKDTILSIPKSDFNTTFYDETIYKLQDTIEIPKDKPTEIYVREAIFSEKKMILLVVNDLEKANWSQINKYKDIYYRAKKEGIPMMMLLSAEETDIKSFQNKYSCQIPVFLLDEKELKAMARSNPLLMALKKGRVTGKYPFRGTPDYSWLKKNALD